jgi:hypothetical protein
MNTVDEMFAGLVGQEIPGGCDTCAAIQTLHREDVGIWRLSVAHDEWCPTLARYQRPTRKTNPNGRK